MQIGAHEVVSARRVHTRTNNAKRRWNDVVRDGARCEAREQLYHFDCRFRQRSLVSEWFLNRVSGLPAAGCGVGVSAVVSGGVGQSCVGEMANTLSWAVRS